jgi:hypothetical protein
MTPELLSSVCAILISLAASYLPWFSPWYEALSGIQKRLLMLGLLVIEVAVILGLVCAQLTELLGFRLSCDRAGFIEAFRVFIVALISNQSAFLISPQKS